MKFVKNKIAWEYEFESTKGMVAGYLRSTARDLVRLAKLQVGVDTGALKSSLNYSLVKSGGGLMVVVGSNNRIAYIHHEGTSPHIITPRRAKTLRFSYRGRIVYTKLVHHPGTKPNRYLTDNLRKVID